MPKKKTSRRKTQNLVISIILFISIVLIGYLNPNLYNSICEFLNINQTSTVSTVTSFNLENIPEYSSNPYVVINNNIPYFTEEDYTTEAFEKYSDLVDGRSGVAFANICKETMPKSGEKRGDISSVKNLSGWVQKKYDSLIKDKYLYNRCHLIGWQLSAENANEKNLITGTRYLNTEGMLPFENMVAEYVRTTKNHVLYRVTPIFENDNLVASGVEIEAQSVEDKGEGICFNVYVYNVQPGIDINYKNGESTLN